MLSITKVANIRQAGSYYISNDNYYSKDTGEVICEWGGKGAKELGIEGLSIDKKQFTELLMGHIEEGIELGRTNVDGSKDHVPAWDFTFSAPKGVSILALAGGDSRLVAAHIESVKAAMTFLEKNYARTRTFKDGVYVRERVDNLLYASFVHTESRAHDPALHSHNVIMNAVKDSEGKWKSLEPIEMYQAKMITGLAYRSEMAKRTKDIGYEIDVTDRQKGFWDISGVPDNVKDALSKRRKIIEQAIKQRGLSDQRSIERATLYTRDSKRPIEQIERDAIWTDTIESLGFNMAEVIQRAKEVHKSYENHSDQHGVTVEATDHNGLESELISDVRLAYKVLSENESVIGHDEILNEALRIGLSKHGIDDINEGIDYLIDNGELIPRVKSSYTTPEILKKETEIVQIMLTGKNKHPIIMDKTDASDHVTKFQKSEGIIFSDDQRDSIIGALTSPDLVTGIKGHAGVGKTTLVRGIIDAAKKMGYDVEGVAPTGSASDTLQNEANIKAATIDSYLYKFRPENINEKSLLIVDESSMSNTSQILDLLKLAKKTNTKILMLGDEDQHGAVEAGKPFGFLATFGMRVSGVTTIQRQKNEDLLNAVKSTIAGDISSAFGFMGDNIIESKDPMVTLFSKWKSLDKDGRDSSLVIIPANEDRAEFNNAARKWLQESGVISKDEIEVNVLTPYSTNNAKMHDSRYYENGLAIEVQKDIGEIKAGFYTIKSIDNKRNELTITPKNDEKEIKINLKDMSTRNDFNMSVFKKENMSISVGDKIIWNKTRNDVGIKNGESLSVKSINKKDGSYILKKEDGNEFSFKGNEWTNIEHGWALTSYKAQGKTVNRVMVLMESWRKNLVNRKSFYVALSRARNIAEIFTENKKDLLGAINERLAEKTTSLDGVTLSKIKNDAIIAGKDDIERKKAISEQVYKEIEITVDKLSAKKSVFSHIELIRESMKWTLGNYDVQDIEDVIEKMRGNGRLSLSTIKQKGNSYDALYTTKENIKVEKNIVVHLKQGVKRFSKISPSSAINKFVEAQNLRDGGNISEKEHQVLLNVMGSTDETVMIAGYENSGHKELIRKVGRHIAEQNKYKFRAFSTNNDGVTALYKSGLPAKNIFYHINKIEQSIKENTRVSGRREIWYVENVSLLGAEETLKLMKLARYSGARLILSADKKENSLSWGAIPDLIQQQGLHFVSMDGQGSARVASTNKATTELYKGDVDEALKALDHMIHSIDGKTKQEGIKARLNAIANIYLNLSKEERESAGVLLPDHYKRYDVNQLIRDGLKVEGSIEKEGIDTTVFREIHLDPFEKREARFYKEGWVVEMESDKSDYLKGDTFVVESINEITNKIIISSTKDKSIKKDFDVSKISSTKGNGIIIYSQENREYVKGDAIRFTRALPKGKGSGNRYCARNTLAKILDINKKTGDVTVRLKNGNEVTFNSKEWKHTEWAYSMHNYHVKDNLYNKIITLMESWNNNFSTQGVLHNALSHASDLSIITDDKVKLIETLRNNDDFQKTAIGMKKIALTKDEKESFDSLFGKALTPAEKIATKLELVTQKVINKFKENRRNDIEKAKEKMYSRQKSL
ncbi:MobF family relaxase [Dickeya sp. NCPPB 3274]|uniref:MobF family relaxase n=1 Tax=Dickeya sp. NCPPB 3274 TaxID=568766 RepID=UPI0003A04754|nr:MobF family relaxase [Dickeya sp. NCPPB 3274]